MKIVKSIFLACIALLIITGCSLEKTPGDLYDQQTGGDTVSRASSDWACADAAPYKWVGRTRRSTFHMWYYNLAEAVMMYYDAQPKSFPHDEECYAGNLLLRVNDIKLLYKIPSEVGGYHVTMVGLYWEYLPIKAVPTPTPTPTPTATPWIPPPPTVDPGGHNWVVVWGNQAVTVYRCTVHGETKYVPK